MITQNQQPVQLPSNVNITSNLSSTQNKITYAGGKNKYRILTICGTIFIVFQLIALFIVFVASGDYKEDAVEVNAAGRQRMLTQRTTKALLVLNSPITTSEEKEKALGELDLSYRVFDDTLEAFKNGGSTTGFDWKSSIDLRKYEINGSQEALDKALGIWSNYGEKIKRILDSESPMQNREAISAAVAAAEVNNLPLLGLMNTMTVALQDLSRDRGGNLQILQTVLLIAVIANFIFMTFGIVKKLRQSDEQIDTSFAVLGQKNLELETTQYSLNESHNDLQSAYEKLTKVSADSEQRAKELAELSEDLSRVQQESDTIFDSVGHGLCLIGDNWKIGSQVSSAMYSIFETDTLSGRSFLELMRPLITEKDTTTLESFLGLLFQPKTSSKQLDKFNPLKSIEVTLNWDGKSFASKHLGFDFKRIIANNEIVSILITVMDVTEKVSLENELKRSAEGRERQVNLILEIIQSDRSELEIFLGKAEKELDEINKSLQTAGVHSDKNSTVADSQFLLEDIFRKVHNIKGNSSLLGLASVTESCAKVEDELVKLRSVKEISGERFLSSLLELAYLRELLTEYEELIHSLLKNFTPGIASSASNDVSSGTAWSEIASLVQKVADEQGKKVALNLLSFNTNLLNENQRSELQDVLIQLARNSVVHGIESPDERMSKGKWAEGSIQISSNLMSEKESPLGVSTLQIDFRDDGNGLDPAVIAKRALQLGMMSKSQLSTFSDAQKVGLIFKSGFSSTDEADEHSGIGAGMDIIRDKIINTLDGKIKLRYETGKLFVLKIMIPIIS